MNKIKTGDKVRIKKPKDEGEWPEWLEEMDMFDGVTIIVPEIREGLKDHFSFNYKGWSYNTRWCEKVEEEMALAQWEKMSPQERLEWNRPAFEALVSAKDDYDLVVEYLDRDGCWSKAGSVDLTVPVRPKKKSADPPKELWVTFVPGAPPGDVLVSGYDSEDKARTDIAEYLKEYEARVVKYVIAE